MSSFLDSHGRLHSLRVTLCGKKSVILSNYFLGDCHSEQNIVLRENLKIGRLRSLGSLGSHLCSLLFTLYSLLFALYSLLSLRLFRLGINNL